MGEERQRDAIDVAEAAYVLHGQAKFVDVRATLVSVQHMTPEAVDAQKETARFTHAVPAQQLTVRAWIDLGKHYGTLAVVFWGLYKLASNPQFVLVIILALVAVFGVMQIIKTLKGKSD